jgi:hypothetical protein
MVKISNCFTGLETYIYLWNHEVGRWLVGEVFDGADDGSFGHSISWRFLEAQGRQMDARS